MITFPSLPFLTEDFAPKGNGIDFLGMLQVNLNIVQTNLIPDINNVTRDVGTYFLGTWISWKFLEMCGEDRNSFKIENFKKFQQAVEVAIAHSSSDLSPSNAMYGKVRNRVGNEQCIDFSGPLTFERVERNASLYDAPLYGPSIRYLGFTQYAMATDHGSAGFMIPNDDSDTRVICKYVDDSLRTSVHYNKLAKLPPGVFSEPEVFDLAMAGLSPARYRNLTGEVHLAAIRKILPSGHRRTDTARLIVATLDAIGPVSSKDLRAVWYTRLSPNGNPFELSDNKLREHAVRWAVFQARQIQRYILESLLCCLERTVDKGFKSVGQIVDALMSTWVDSPPMTFAELIDGESMKPECSREEQAASWCANVGPNNPQFDFITFVDNQDAFPNALKSLARWWLRVQGDKELRDSVSSVAGDESGRIPMLSFHRWIKDRLDDDIKLFVTQLLAEFVFSQHLRIALSRLDSRGIRQRLTLGDTGIERTRKVENFARTTPPNMADRLDALIDLMDDLNILKLSDSKTVDIGSFGKEFLINY